MVNYTKSFANRNSIETLRKFLEKFFLETNGHTFEDAYFRLLKMAKASESLEE
jgi:hypothetical protein